MKLNDYLQEHALVLNLDQFIKPAVDLEDVGIKFKKVNQDAVLIPGYSDSALLNDMVKEIAIRNNTTYAANTNISDDFCDELKKRLTDMNWTIDMATSAADSCVAEADLYVMDRFFQSDKQMICLEISKDEDIDVDHEKTLALQLIANRVQRMIARLSLYNAAPNSVGWRKFTNFTNAGNEDGTTHRAMLYSTRAAYVDFTSKVVEFVEADPDDVEFGSAVAHYIYDLRPESERKATDTKCGMSVDKAIRMLRTDIRKTKKDLDDVVYGLFEDYGYIVDLRGYSQDSILCSKVAKFDYIVKPLNSGEYIDAGIIGSGKDLKRFMDAVVKILLDHANCVRVEYKGIERPTSD